MTWVVKAKTVCDSGRQLLDQIVRRRFALRSIRPMFSGEIDSPQKTEGLGAGSMGPYDSHW